MAMEEKIQMAGVGGSAEFWCGKDVFKVLMDMAQGYLSTADQKMIRVELGAGQITIGGYVIHVLSETYPEPASGTWVPKLNAKTLMAVARDVPGTIWYCALDSISAGLAALPLHIGPIQAQDDSGITLIAQSKPVPARPPKATCLCVAVA